MLGGVRFEGERGLEGHSDADVVAHACADALLGAAGLGDIGEHFPDSDPAFAGADSLVLLAEVARRVRGRVGSRPTSTARSCSTRPKLAPHRDEMQARLAEAVGAPVTVKGKRPERIGALGRGEGVMALAVALLEPLPDGRAS